MSCGVTSGKGRKWNEGRKKAVKIVRNNATFTSTLIINMIIASGWISPLAKNTVRPLSKRIRKKRLRQ